MNKPEAERHSITQMLYEWSEGNAQVLDELMPLVYEELHRQASRYLRRERKDHTLQTTALIHEAYLKLINQGDVRWESRTHFFAIAAQAMRRILVDYARMKHSSKRGGDDAKVSLEETVLIASEEKGIDLIALDEALTRFAEIDPQQARVVELRYFGDLSLEETAEALHISRATVAREWNTAKVWLHRELTR
jgi:RNA polymerase sigma-70 factor (ECF subfamily)